MDTTSSLHSVHSSLTSSSGSNDHHRPEFYLNGYSVSSPVKKTATHELRTGTTAAGARFILKFFGPTARLEFEKERAVLSALRGCVPGPAASFCARSPAGTRYVLVAPRVEAVTLEDYAKKIQSEQELAKVVDALKICIMKMHRRLVAHRSLTPDHVLYVESESRILLCGLSKARMGSTDLTEDTKAFGKLVFFLCTSKSYSSPEDLSKDTIYDWARELAKNCIAPTDKKRMRLAEVLDLCSEAGESRNRNGKLDYPAAAYKVRAESGFDKANESYIGEGSYGTVRHVIKDGKELAVKTMKRNLDIKSGHTFGNLLQEVGLLKMLQESKYFATLYDYFYADGTYYIVMEYCNSGNLLQYFKNKKNSTFDNEYDMARWIAWEVANAIFVMHSRDIVHRDIKLENIMLTDRGQGLEIKIVDFGVAKRASMMNTLVGTQVYMAPEVSGKDRNYTNRADVWSYGIMLYVLAYGTHPDVKECDYKINCTHNAKMSPEYMAIMRSCLIKDPQKRPSIAEVLASKCFDEQVGRLKFTPWTLHWKDLSPEMYVVGKELFRDKCTTMYEGLYAPKGKRLFIKQFEPGAESLAENETKTCYRVMSSYSVLLLGAYGKLGGKRSLIFDASEVSPLRQAGDVDKLMAAYGVADALKQLACRQVVYNNSLFNNVYVLAPKKKYVKTLLGGLEFAARNTEQILKLKTDAWQYGKFLYELYIGAFPLGSAADEMLVPEFKGEDEVQEMIRDIIRACLKGPKDRIEIGTILGLPIFSAYTNSSR